VCYAIDTMQDGFRKLKAKILENGGMVQWWNNKSLIRWFNI